MADLSEEKKDLLDKFKDVIENEKKNESEETNLLFNYLNSTSKINERQYKIKLDKYIGILEKNFDSIDLNNDIEINLFTKLSQIIDAKKISNKLPAENTSKQQLNTIIEKVTPILVQIMSLRNEDIQGNLELISVKNELSDYLLIYNEYDLLSKSSTPPPTPPPPPPPSPPPATTSEPALLLTPDTLSKVKLKSPTQSVLDKKKKELETLNKQIESLTEILEEVKSKSSVLQIDVNTLTAEENERKIKELEKSIEKLKEKKVITEKELEAKLTDITNYSNNKNFAKIGRDVFSIRKSKIEQEEFEKELETLRAEIEAKRAKEEKEIVEDYEQLEIKGLANLKEELGKFNKDELSDNIDTRYNKIEDDLLSYFIENLGRKKITTQAGVLAELDNILEAQVLPTRYYALDIEKYFKDQTKTKEKDLYDEIYFQKYNKYLEHNDGYKREGYIRLHNVITGKFFNFKREFVREVDYEGKFVVGNDLFLEKVREKFLKAIQEQGLVQEVETTVNENLKGKQKKGGKKESPNFNFTLPETRIKPEEDLKAENFNLAYTDELLKQAKVAEAKTAEEKATAEATRGGSIQKKKKPNKKKSKKYLLNKKRKTKKNKINPNNTKKTSKRKQPTKRNSKLKHQIN